MSSAGAPPLPEPQEGVEQVEIARHERGPWVAAIAVARHRELRHVRARIRFYLYSPNRARWSFAELDSEAVEAMLPKLVNAIEELGRER